MAYNPWYTATYQPILDMANWSILTADIEKKVVAVFSWMPKTIMAINHAGRRYKWEIYGTESMRSALEPVQERFSAIQNEHLKDFVISRNSALIGELFEALFPIVGPSPHRNICISRHHSYCRCGTTLSAKTPAVRPPEMGTYTTLPATSDSYEFVRIIEKR